LVLVATGGLAGTATRELLTLAAPPSGGFPAATFLINISGAFVLGLLLDALARRGPDEGRLQALRLLAGTGFCGGFTTYSALATDTALLVGEGDTGSAMLYAFGTLLAGGAASWAGIVVAERLHSLCARSGNGSRRTT
jgi:CrcB protein